jgi:membrane associated rhomboid family serine protease
VSRTVDASANPLIPRPTPGVIALIVVLTVAYAAQLLAIRAGFGDFVSALMLHPDQAALGGRLWQPFTTMLLHDPGSVGHLLNNALMLWLFGTTLEQQRGRRWLITTFVTCGVAGALATILVGGLLHLVLPNTQFDAIWNSAVMGASGGALGLLVSWIAIHWGKRINLFLFGLMKAQTFGMVVVVIEVLVALSYDGTSSTSHFGGMGMGFLIGRGLWPPKLSRKVRVKRKHAKTQDRLRRFEVIEGGRRGDDDNDDDTAGPPIWGGGDKGGPTIH